MEQKKGTVMDVVFTNSENGYTIAIVENGEEQFTAVGYMHQAAAGRTFVFSGEWKQHPSYGEQFAFSEYEEQMPTTKDGIEAFLASGMIKGIGKKTAAWIVNKFGEETLDIMENHPEKLVKVEGIGEKKAAIIGESYRNHREVARITIFLQEFGITANYAMKLYKIYGEHTVEAVKANPYQLVDDIFGIGFKKADKIAENMGIPTDDPHRIKSAIEYALSYYTNEGHTFVPQKFLSEKTAELIDIETEKINDRMIEMVFEGDIHIESIEGRSVVFLMAYFVAEQNVSRKLTAINNAIPKPINSDIGSLISLTEKEKNIQLSENQRFAIKSSLVSGVSVITGGPGTGKTTIINSIISILNSSGLTTAIAAPTGRAAKRITETSGYSASTIHRLLEYYYSEDEDRAIFGKNEEDPLEYDTIVIDEASMIDILLMNGLINAIKPGTRLIIVGDADQLPSVGAGNVLRDIIDSEIIYSVKLTEIFRQAKESLIVVNAHKINKGEYPDFNEKGKDFFFMRKNGETQMLETIKELCSTRLPAYYTDCDRVKDIQVLTPVRKGIIGTMNLNNVLQSVLNSPSDDLREKKFGDKLFREKDKVMQIKNNYQLEWKRRSDFTEGQGVFNGDVGFVEKIDIEFNQMIVIFDEDKYVTYEFAQLDELELAYAVTVHKSQGSEFPIIILPVSWFPPMLATRNLLYTAVTRGKNAVVLVGSQNKLEGMVDNNRITERYSGLKARLQKSIASGTIGNPLEGGF